MRITRKSIRQAAKEARGYSQGDLFIVGNRVSFLVGYRNTLDRACLITDWWNKVQTHTVAELIELVDERMAAGEMEAIHGQI